MLRFLPFVLGATVAAVAPGNGVVGLSNLSFWASKWLGRGGTATCLEPALACLATTGKVVAAARGRSSARRAANVGGVGNLTSSLGALPSRGWASIPQCFPR